ncbi:MAG TPA: Crp/Fnr family transcriptional regulator [Ktedonobacterales bacterium]|nr:Crp/Fnr family transcriptional regulator [Ktedonobacterales bacterium]
MRLEVYLPHQYPDRQEALNLIKQAEQIAGLQVVVRSVGSGDLRDFFAGAMPIYLLDGQLVAAGHPPPETLLAFLRQAVQESSRATDRAAARETPIDALRDVFRSLGQEELAALSAEVRLKPYAKGARIFLQGEAADAMYLLRQGRVELYHLTRHGKRLKLGVMRPGMIFGEACVLAGGVRYATAEVVEAAQVIAIDRAEVERLIREEPNFALYLAKELGRRLQLSNWRLVTLAYADVSTRLAAELLHVSREERATLLPITHQELAERSGLLRETVTKTLDAFQEEGLVELHRGQVRLRDVRGLRTLLEPLNAEGILQG